MMLPYCLATFTHKRCLSYSGRYLPEYLPEDREHDKDNFHKRGIIYHCNCFHYIQAAERYMQTTLEMFT